METYKTNISWNIKVEKQSRNVRIMILIENNENLLYFTIKSIFYPATSIQFYLYSAITQQWLPQGANNK